METRINGRAIIDYKDFEVSETSLAVPKAEPLYTPAILNGYAPNDFIVDNSLVLYLPLDLLKGDKFKSIDRYKHSCSITGALWRPNSRLFDGDDFIDCGNNAGLSVDYVTLEAWVKVAGADDYSVLHKGRNDNFTGDYTFEVRANNIYFAIYTTSEEVNLSSTDPVTTDVWHHVVGVYNGTNTITYADGEQVRSTAHTEVLAKTGDKLWVGTRGREAAGKDLYFDGNIGEVRIYNRALSATEILHNYNVTRWRYP